MFPVRSRSACSVALIVGAPARRPAAGRRPGGRPGRRRRPRLDPSTTPATTSTCSQRHGRGHVDRPTIVERDDAAPRHGRRRRDGTSVTYTPDRRLPRHRHVRLHDRRRHIGATDTVTVDVTSTARRSRSTTRRSACQDPDTFGGGFPSPRGLHLPHPADAGLLHLVRELRASCTTTRTPTVTLTWEIVTAAGARRTSSRSTRSSSGTRRIPTTARRPRACRPISTRSPTARSTAFAYSAPATMRDLGRPDQRRADVHRRAGSRRRRGQRRLRAAWATDVSSRTASESWQTVQFEADVDLNGVPNLFAVVPRLDANGNLTFTPAADEVGLVHVTVRAKDDGGLEDWTHRPDPPTTPATTSPSTSSSMPDAVDAVDDAPRSPRMPAATAASTSSTTTPSPSASILTVTGRDPGNARASVDDHRRWRGPHLRSDRRTRDGADTLHLHARRRTTAASTPRPSHVTMTSVNDAPAAPTRPRHRRGRRSLRDRRLRLTGPNDSLANAHVRGQDRHAPDRGSLTNDGAASSSSLDLGGRHRRVQARIHARSPAPPATRSDVHLQVRDTADGERRDRPRPSANTITIDVGPVNDAPVGADRRSGSLEDAPYTLLAADFEFSDRTTARRPPERRDDHHAPDRRQRANDGATFLAGTLVPSPDIAATGLTFTPAAERQRQPARDLHLPGPGRRRHGQRRRRPRPDAPTRSRINVTARNDAPGGTEQDGHDRRKTSRYTLVPADFGFTDTSDSPANDPRCRQDHDPAVGGPAQEQRRRGRRRRFDPGRRHHRQQARLHAGRSTANGSPYASFTFQVQDNGGTANGGTDLDRAPTPSPINVTPVQDPPDARNDATLHRPRERRPDRPGGPGQRHRRRRRHDARSPPRPTAPTARWPSPAAAPASPTTRPSSTSGPTSFTYTISDGHGGTDTRDRAAHRRQGHHQAESSSGRSSRSTPRPWRARPRGPTSPGRAPMPGPGIEKYQLQVSVNGGSFINLTLGSATATSVNIDPDRREELPLPGPGDRQPGQRQRLGQRPDVQAGPHPEHSTSVVYTGPWATVSTASALGGSHRYASSLAARASVTRTTRDIGLVVTKTTTSGLRRGLDRRRPGGDHQPALELDRLPPARLRMHFALARHAHHRDPPDRRRPRLPRRLPGPPLTLALRFRRDGLCYTAAAVSGRP